MIRFTLLALCSSLALVARADNVGAYNWTGEHAGDRWTPQICNREADCVYTFRATVAPGAGLQPLFVLTTADCGLDDVTQQLSLFDGVSDDANPQGKLPLLRKYTDCDLTFVAASSAGMTVLYTRVHAVINSPK